MQAFTIAWDSPHKKWISLQPNELITPDDPLHWTQRVYNWNHFCADCHSTGVDKNYDTQTTTYHTTFTSINVACQACHQHIDPHHWQKTKSQTSKTPAAEEIIDTCAVCHSRRHAITSHTELNKTYLDNYEPEILRKNIYYPDGGIQAEDYEYGSFIQSKMYQSGVSCIDCHHPHSLQLKAPGNGVCLQCHNVTPPRQRFPALKAKNYNTSEHHFHQPNSTGSQCINCHMPAHTYMQIDVRHDHYFRIPRPELTIKYHIPNACNTCHTDKTAQWARDYIIKWYGKKNITQNNTDVFFLGRAGDPKAVSSLIAAATNSKHPAIVRATAIELLAQYHTPQCLTAMLSGTKDCHPLVRLIAIRSLRNLPAALKIKFIVPLLNDPFSSVRMEAARNLVDVVSQFTPAQRQLFEKNFLAYQQAQMAQIDQPEGNYNLGIAAQEQGQYYSAEMYFKMAIKLDEHFYPGSEKLAILYNLMGKNAKAMEVLKNAIASNKNQGELYYSLGLLFAEESDYKNSAAMLANAIRLMPANARVYYNASLALQQLGNLNQAEKMLLAANRLSPHNPLFLNALLHLSIQQNKWVDAHDYAIQLAAIEPHTEQIQTVVEMINRHL